MTVKELVEALKSFPENEEVVYRGVSGNYETIDDIEIGYALDGDSEMVLLSEIQSHVVDKKYNQYVALVGD